VTKYFIIVVLIFSIISCKKDSLTKYSFNDFWVEFNQVVNNEDKEKLSTLLSDDIRYSVGDDRDNYSRDEIIENFDYELTRKILSEGYYLSKNNIIADCPPHNENMNKYDYILRFRVYETGWKLHLMDMMH
jgi:hypothetical protein